MVLGWLLYVTRNLKDFWRAAAATPETPGQAGFQGRQIITNSHQTPRRTPTSQPTT
jgi:hypothetical protein